MPDQNGQTATLESEIKEDVVHAGLSVQLNLLKTDSVL